ncbi:glutamate racemase [Desulfosporosinus orientis DSM 765]|uniref:Glutamate racemase n=1 Tax=Desulfosporosinus orientis (strain ATCC 19365 / DSM 765 / NCIMB 8382 / VKM B-1628 / Singapore I) TaxID=768706 RepID=G7W9U3_DESOD|nr:glutamate racemase [Desulfosporosinus orientis]AET70659.1 glutamate racemase [Desulfosporosinus orientis DSM 765]
MKKQRIIGMFDSGVGGLTVMKEILEQLLDVRIVYFGDTARVPYGNRTQEELIRFGEEIVTFLIGQGAEVIVVACNSSSATALPVLRERFDVPMIGMIEPGARLAVEKTIAGRIGLIATETTVRSKAYSTAVSRALAKGCLPENLTLREAWQHGEHPIALTKAQGCPLFVPLIEAGLANSEQARGIARTYLAPLHAAGVDTLILGCTHYPFLAPVLREILGEDVLIIDPAWAVVRELETLLRHLDEWEQSGLIGSPSQAQGKNPWRARYFVSGDPELFRQVGNTLLQEPIGHVEQKALGE